MTETGDVLDFLRGRFARLDDRLDRFDRKLDEVVTRLGVLQRKVAGIELDYAAIQQRLDNIDCRLDRIERRLELADRNAASALRHDRAREVMNTPDGRAVTHIALPNPGFDRKKARAALRRIGERAEMRKLGPFDWGEWKSYPDAGRG